MSKGKTHYASYEAPHEGDNCEYWSLTACGRDRDNVTQYEEDVTCKNCLKLINKSKTMTHQRIKHPLAVISKETGERHEVWKVIHDGKNQTHIWCHSWYGRHKIGADCEWATAENDRAKDLVDAAEKIVKMFAHKNDHETCAICQLGKALAKWKGEGEQ